MRAEIDPTLWPFAEETLVDLFRSVGLRHYGEVVSWMVAHRVSPEFVRFTALYVRERWRTPKQTIGMLAEAFRRKLAHYGSSVAVLLAVRVENTGMVQICERHLRPTARSWTEMREAEKMLCPAS